MTHHAAQRALDRLECPVRCATRGRGQEAREQLVQLHLLGRNLVLNQIADDGEQQGDEGDDGEEQIERQGAREKRDVVLVGRFDSAADDAGH